ncbi:MAG: hypothetical protein Edafosvirus2_54 [Edafosvirus sp.]|uniref:Uncharacterized protein n=1 Tax=Edafosvirus sp. TaxID=2487765 RepID=A0A3G4ZSL0_9VIRU|nr:MAG: hypothetical protein Edafosvirus2_54 [Edafosvirus sp.]
MNCKKINTLFLGISIVILCFINISSLLLFIWFTGCVLLTNPIHNPLNKSKTYGLDFAFKWSMFNAFYISILVSLVHIVLLLRNALGKSELTHLTMNKEVQYLIATTCSCLVITGVFMLIILYIISEPNGFVHMLSSFFVFSPIVFYGGQILAYPSILISDATKHLIHTFELRYDSLSSPLLLNKV